MASARFSLRTPRHPLATSALLDFVETKILNRKVRKRPRKGRKEKAAFLCGLRGLAWRSSPLKGFDFVPNQTPAQALSLLPPKV
jgi:hypothetical protein